VAAILVLCQIFERLRGIRTTGTELLDQRGEHLCWILLGYIAEAVVEEPQSCLWIGVIGLLEVIYDRGTVTRHFARYQKLKDEFPT